MHIRLAHGKPAPLCVPNLPSHRAVDTLTAVARARRHKFDRNHRKTTADCEAAQKI